MAETRWRNSGEEITAEGHKIIYSGQKKYHQQWVVFIVKKELTSSIFKYELISIVKDEHRKVHNLIKRSMKRAKEVWQSEYQCNQIDYDD